MSGNQVARRPNGSNGNGAMTRPAAGAPGAFTEFVKANKAQLYAVAAEQVDVRRLYQMVVGCFSKNPELAKCSPDSIFRSMLQCAELGLEPASVLGEVYLIPYGQECTAIVGYRGLINLARRSGHVQTIQAECVYEGDEFDYEFGLQDKLVHRPGGNENDPNRITHVWALAKFKDGGYQFIVMKRGEIDAIRARSRAGKSGPWVTDYGEMAKKTAIRRLAKHLPMSIQMARGIEVSDANEFGDGIEVKFLDDPTTEDPVAPAPAQQAQPQQPPRQAAAAPSPRAAAPENKHLASHKGYLKNRGLDPEDVTASCRLLAWALERDDMDGADRAVLTDEEWAQANAALMKLDRSAIPAIIAGPQDEPQANAAEPELAMSGVIE